MSRTTRRNPLQCPHSTAGRPAVQVKLRGVTRVRYRRSDGQVMYYHYAWRGGPRLEGEPGSPEFLRSYEEAVKQRQVTATGTILELIQGYRASTSFRDLRDRTRADYLRHLDIIEEAFGDFPLDALGDRRTRGEFLAWRDRLAAKSRRQADYSWTVLARLFSWSYDRGLVTLNPCLSGGRVYRAERSERIWTEQDERAFYALAPAHLHLPLCLAIWTGQRQGDLLALTWRAYDGTHLRLVPSKSISRVRRRPGTRLEIPLGAPVRARLDKLREQCPSPNQVILLNQRGQPWTPGGFRASWRTACAAAGVSGVTFHDLRGTAVTRLALAGATPAEIATFTGHSLRDVNAILDTHYLARDSRLADNALKKLEAG